MKTFRNNQVVMALDQNEVAAILHVLRAQYLVPGKTVETLNNKLFDALIGAGRDPAKFGYGPGKYQAHAGWNGEGPCPCVVQQRVSPDCTLHGEVVDAQ